LANLFAATWKVTTPYFVLFVVNVAEESSNAFSYMHLRTPGVQ